ncbi:hypothetical protein NC653_016014 [Populus alba x Populus x berolinensis]|uniref:Uncharacterized protein n=1 Tax=Populus alba x Populus x berolinensis TaxID=444605 RepID=A0AAD6QLR6_9ROSI|nr:hypothetical protein NC653_016014 [Populus alba x Populus x berolinensis]
MCLCLDGGGPERPSQSRKCLGRGGASTCLEDQLHLKGIDFNRTTEIRLHALASTYIAGD